MGCGVVERHLAGALSTKKIIFGRYGLQSSSAVKTLFTVFVCASRLTKKNVKVRRADFIIIDGEKLSSTASKGRSSSRSLSVTTFRPSKTGKSYFEDWKNVSDLKKIILVFFSNSCRTKMKTGGAKCSHYLWFEVMLRTFFHSFYVSSNA